MRDGTIFRRRQKAKPRMVVFCWVLAWCTAVSPAMGAAPPVDPLLYFVGEDLSLLTVASRRPETPQRAPAMVRIVTAREIRERGYRTVADVLRTQAGFVIRPGERGSTPYIRGIREGFLFLYDGVPLNSHVTKGIHPLDEELSLAAVERIEIVLGPGSVLWGPDAYAGIINIVPKREIPGSEASHGQMRAWGGTQRDRGAGFTLSGSRGPVRGLLTASAERRRYWDAEYATTSPTQTGLSAETETVGEAEFAEALATVDLWDRVHITGRLADHTNRFTMRDTAGLSWAGEKRTPLSFIKATTTHHLGASDVTASAYYTRLRLDLGDGDVQRSQTDDVFSGEVVWYRPIGGAGGLTAGLGYREERTQDAVVRDGFLPEFLKPRYKVFVPPIVQADFDNGMASAFAQVRHRLGPLDSWIGVRYDDADAYDPTVTANAGLMWPISNEVRLKATYGTAYRNPYAAQLYADRSLEPEGIRTAALEFGWFASPHNEVTLTLFHNTITRHLQEDPYGGLSQPADHRSVGMEVQGRARLHPRFDLYGAFSAHDDGEDRVRYQVLKAFYFAPDGTKTPIYESWQAPLDEGPEWSAFLGLQWRLRDRWSLSVESLWTADWSYADDKGTRRGHYEGEHLVRGVLRIEDMPWRGSSLDLVMDNLLDQGGSVPGIFGPAQRPPLRAWLEWRWDF